MTFKEWWKDNTDLLMFDKYGISCFEKAWRDATNAERERCVKVCEDNANFYLTRSSKTGDYHYAKSVAAESCASLIRVPDEPR